MSGFSREQVALHQRARLRAAMIEAVAAHGYAATTVDELVRLAGVSTRTLYERFGGKQECFLATYDLIVERGLTRLGDLHRAQRGEQRDWAAWLPPLLDALFQEIAEHPKEAQLALVEVLAAGPAVLPAVRRCQATLERAVGQALERHSDPPGLPDVLVKGLIHGVWHVTRTCLVEDRPKRLRELAPELLSWAACYRCPQLALLPGAAAPREGGAWFAQTHGLGGDSRLRALRATAQIAAREGYGAVSVARICQEAAVELDELLAMYQSPEQCFLASLELLSAKALSCALEPVRGRPPQDLAGWREALHRSAGALLAAIAADPVLAQVAFVEVLCAGGAGAERRAAIMRGFADILISRAPRSRRPSRTVADAIAGAIWGIIHDHVLAGQLQLLPTLANHIAYIVLAPMFGAHEAIETILAEAPATPASGAP